MSVIEDKVCRENLLKNVKKEVKQLMEVSVTRKLIHEDNSCITSLCASVEACILHGLKSCGFLKANTTLNLITRISKQCPDADAVVRLCEEYDRLYCDTSSEFYYKKISKNKSLQGNSLMNSNNKFNLFSKKAFKSTEIFNDSGEESASLSSQRCLYFSPTFYKGSACYKFLWVRLALLNKCLTKIVDFIINNSPGQYYAASALCADPVDGVILSSLLVGPCALEFTRMKVCENLWQDPNATELIQRHRMQGSSSLTQSYAKIAIIQSRDNKSAHSNETKTKALKSKTTCSEAENSNKPSDSQVSSARKVSSSENYRMNTLSASPKVKLGHSASIQAKRKASISALDDISNGNNSKLNFSGGNSSACSGNLDATNVTSPTPSQTRLGKRAQLQKCPARNESTPQIACTKNQKLVQIGAPLRESHLIPKNLHAQSICAINPAPSSAKEYVESLHQNSRSQLIYGKNSVIVKQRELELVGYMSLHLNSQIGSLLLKWTPNEMMSGNAHSSLILNTKIQTSYWDYAVHIDLNSIVYMHCHRNSCINSRSSSSSEEKDESYEDWAQLVLVGQDGIQHTPFYFPSVNSLVQFLICLETALLPHGKLEPPIGDSESDIARVMCSNFSSSNSIDSTETTQPDQQQDDFLFKIINTKSNVAFAMIKEPHRSNSKTSTKSQSSSISSLEGQINPDITLKQTKQSKNFIGTFFSSPVPLKNEITLEDCHLSGTHSNREKLESNSHNTPSATQSSLILDNSNGLQFLSKIENLQLSPIDFIEYEKSRRCSSNQSVSSTSSQVTPKMLKSLTMRGSLKKLCDTMQKQILTRAFYGWLTYHRNLKTVGLHLTGLVNGQSSKTNAKALTALNGPPEPNQDLELNTIPLKNSESYIFKCIQDLDQLQPGEENYLRKLESSKILCLNCYLENDRKLDQTLWHKIVEEAPDGRVSKQQEMLIYKIVYLHGVDQGVRKKVWPFLLEHFRFDSSESERCQKEKTSREAYSNLIAEWQPFQEFIYLREKRATHLSQRAKSASIKKKQRLVRTDKQVISGSSLLSQDSGMFLNETQQASQNSTQNDNCNNTEAASNNKQDQNDQRATENTNGPSENKQAGECLVSNEDDCSDNRSNNDVFLDSFNLASTNSVNANESDDVSIQSSDAIQTPSFSMIDKTKRLLNKLLHIPKSSEAHNETTDLSITHTSSVLQSTPINQETASHKNKSDDFTSYDDSESYLAEITNLVARFLVDRSISKARRVVLAEQDANGEKKAHSQGRACLTNKILVNSFALNIHRIDKDVTRCDRNYWYFSHEENLNKLRNIVYTYVWENLEIGYIQGMCDLVAPLLVMFDDESMTYACFKQLMLRMNHNFPHGSAMDQNFSSMRLLIQILDSDLYEHMYNRGDFTHFYFSYRWFLLDFKRELLYEDVFTVWETIWAAKFVCSQFFYLFIGLALVETYRDIIIENNMDFTDIIKFFNEMAEKHKVKQVLALARNQVVQLQKLIYNKDGDF